MSDACVEKEKEREHGKNAKSYTQRKLAERNCKLPPYLINAVLIPKCCRKTKNQISSLFFIFLHKHMWWVVVRVHSYVATVGVSVQWYRYRTQHHSKMRLTQYGTVPYVCIHPLQPDFHVFNTNCPKSSQTSWKRQPCSIFTIGSTALQS